MSGDLNIRRKRRRNPAQPGPSKRAIASTSNGLNDLSLPSVSGSVVTPKSNNASLQSRNFTSSSVQSETLRAHLSDTRFSSFVQQGLLNSSINLPFDTCTDVQAKTLPTILNGGDVLAQAKTGTGKTLAFLIPTIQRLLLSKRSRPVGNVGALILSPTRELAAQIAEAAKPLLRDIPNMEVQISTGGNNVNTELRSLRSKRCDILVATPGRLLDHLKNNGFAANLQGLQALVLDEADRLLDAGFKNDIIAISKLLPDRSSSPRQSLLFSATISKDVKDVASAVLSTEHTFVSTLLPGEANVHEHVPQFVVTAPLADSITATVAVIRQEITATQAAKIMLFLPTARSTGIFYAALEKLQSDVLNGIPVLQIHSRMSQSARTKAADQFKDLKSAILVSSDVTARGMDFPNVTHVLQCGIPQNPEQYIHRLGRTARAGQTGRGIIILTPDEMVFLRHKEIAALSIKPMEIDAAAFAAIAGAVDASLDAVSTSLKASAYAAWLGCVFIKCHRCSQLSLLFRQILQGILQAIQLDGSYSD
ncbi:hypothetical protein EMMF5_002143 [Cystobasidiomycetes sp. EMM_F5]